jgi:hypothetical protein
MIELAIAALPYIIGACFGVLALALARMGKE